MAVLVWPSGGVNGGSTSGVQNPMNAPMVFNSTVEINDAASINDSLIVTAGAQTFSVSSAGGIEFTSDIGGTGGSSASSLASHFSSWTPTVVFAQGTCISYAVQKSFWWRIGNVVECRVYFHVVQSAQVIGDIQIWRLSLPVPATFTHQYEVIGVAQAYTVSAHANIFGSMYADTAGNNTANFQLRNSIAVASGTVKYYALSYSYVVNV